MSKHRPREGYLNFDSVMAFLYCPTPRRWLENAREHQADLLIDHANCEKKAASMAVRFLFSDAEKTDLCNSFSRIAREELRHYEQVMQLLQKRGIPYRRLAPSRYFKGLRAHMHSDEKARFIDMLLIGAIIEARSCERFYWLGDWVDSELRDFYARLYTSEQRHFSVYLDFAYAYAPLDGKDEAYIRSRLQCLLQAEQTLIETPDEHFGFHSGPLAE